MRKTIFAVCLLLASLACAPATRAQNEGLPPASAQPQPPVHFYHLKLVVQDLDADGKVINSRSYSTSISTKGGNHSSIRVRTRIPVATGGNNFSYSEIGNNFDIRDATEIGGQLAFWASADITTEAAPAAIQTDPPAKEPVTRHNQWEAHPLIPLGKPTVIFTSDALDSKGAMQVVATATAVSQ